MNDKTRAILFALSVTMMLSYLTVSLGIDSVSAQEAHGNEDPEEPTTANENTIQEDQMSDELRVLDGLAQSVVDLQIENQRLAESSDDESVRDVIEANDRRIAELIGYINEL